MRLPVPSRRRSVGIADASLGSPESADSPPDPAGPADAPLDPTDAADAADAADPATDPATEPPPRPRRPLYARLLHLRHVAPNAWQRAVLGEGSLALAAVLVLADLATAWTLLVLPLAVAALVKGHDLLARLLGRPEVPPPAPRRAGRAPRASSPGRTNGAGPSRDGAVGGGAG